MPVSWRERIIGERIIGERIIGRNALAASPLDEKGENTAYSLSVMDTLTDALFQV